MDEQVEIWIIRYHNIEDIPCTYVKGVLYDTLSLYTWDPRRNTNLTIIRIKREKINGKKGKKKDTCIIDVGYVETKSKRNGQNKTDVFPEQNF